MPTLRRTGRTEVQSGWLEWPRSQLEAAIYVGFMAYAIGQSKTLMPMLPKWFFVATVSGEL